jgi:hypothetical protein
MGRSISTGLLVLSLALIAAPIHAQSLGDLSKAEEARRKTIKEPSKVYTDKDLKPAPMAPDADAAPADENAPADADAAKDAGADAAKDAAASDDTSGDKAEDKADAAKPAQEEKGEAYWSGRAKELQSQLERDQSYAEALQSRINALNTDFANRSDPAQRSIVEQDRNKALAEAERLSQAIENDKKAISDFQDEARRSGVPPGWLR